MKSDEQPDMIMMSRYAEIDLDETPIVALGCGHFFTTETLDGHVGLKDVYQVDEKTGRFVGLVDNAELSAAIPQCPSCRAPIKQYVTQRYNRLINRAVIDEMSKRFIVSGQQELQQLEDRLSIERSNLEGSRTTVVPTSSILTNGKTSNEATTRYINQRIQNRHESTIKLLNDVKSFCHRVDDQHQPTYKLHQATVHSVMKNASIDDRLSKLTIRPSFQFLERDRDQRITLGGDLLEIKVRGLILEDKFDIARSVRLKNLASQIALSFRGGSPITKTSQFLKDCEKLVSDCMNGHLPKLAVEASLYYAQIAQLFASSGFAKDTDRTKAMSYRSTAKKLLAEAEKLCNHSFRDRDSLRQAVIYAITMINQDFYEVSREEIEAIKKAMVSGPGGIATHSGHWYKCVNGHPVSQPE
jgi:hypothetical protein